MKKMPVVALIGQTNAGKSSLLNRLAHQNIAIVAREEGTTRDNVIAEIWENQSENFGSDFNKKTRQHRNRSSFSQNRRGFLLIDTAGLKDPDDDFEASIQDQIRDAIENADLILVTLDSSKYPDYRDKQIAKDALRSKKPVFLVLNKSDLGESLSDTEFLSLGIRSNATFRTSATTGQGTNSLKSAIFNLLFQKTGNFASVEGNQGNLNESFTSIEENQGDSGNNFTSLEETQATPLKIALIGRPNVGKSSLFNSLAKKQQALVSARQGTTRDINRVKLRFKGRELEILDTAGLRKPGRREVGIEKFSAIRTLAAIEEADICALLVDASEPHSKLDQALAGQIIEAGKGIILIVTKSDLLKNATPTNYFGEETIKNRTAADFLLDNLEKDYDFLPFAPVLITSAKTGENVTELFDLALKIDEARHFSLKTADLNRILNAAILAHAPAGLKNTHPRPKYIVQTDVCPPWFVVHGHNLELLHWSWKRFLERKIREFYPFLGTPIMFSFRSDKEEKSVKLSSNDVSTRMNGHSPKSPNRGR